MAKATFGAGCFWGVEAEFRRLQGVTATAAGYAGGGLDNPTYEQVCSNTTGHAEVVQVDFDPEVISYEELVDHFWRLHDPTQVNRQGPDIGTQYRSVIFTHDDEQAAVASASRERAQQSSSRPIATQIVPAAAFWPAEEYHQRYLEKKGLASCTVQLQQSTAS
jgi:peptide-methionine (S)-S-oxide reductase